MANVLQTGSSEEGDGFDAVLEELRVETSGRPQEVQNLLDEIMEKPVSEAEVQSAKESFIGTSIFAFGWRIAMGEEFPSDEKGIERELEHISYFCQEANADPKVAVERVTENGQYWLVICIKCGVPREEFILRMDELRGISEGIKGPEK